MTYSNRLDLDRFFFAVRNNIYVIVKLSEEFPNYYRGSDIDVFCYNKDELAKLILSVGNRYLDQGFEINVTAKSKSQTFVDFYFDGVLEFRFDLYQSLPKYKKIRLKAHYILSVIENAVQLYREFDGVRYPIYVPSEVDELLLRYVEYIEWYELRPDKIKHLDYIINSISYDSNRIRFIDKLHLYTELPEQDYGVRTKKTYSPRFVRYIKSVLGRLISKFPFLERVYYKLQHLNRQKTEK
jgi:hypothetical protein